MAQLKCPAWESTEFLCDRDAEYQVNGTIYCNKHARRLIEAMDEARALARVNGAPDG